MRPTIFDETVGNSKVPVDQELTIPVKEKAKYSTLLVVSIAIIVICVIIIVWYMMKDKKQNEEALLKQQLEAKARQVRFDTRPPDVCRVEPPKPEEPVKKETSSNLAESLDFLTKVNTIKSDVDEEEDLAEAFNKQTNGGVPIDDDSSE